jgi:hypothetical protein
MTESDAKKLQTTMTQTNETPNESDDNLWWHIVLNLRVATRWWNKVMTQSKQTKWGQKMMTQFNYFDTNR